MENNYLKAYKEVLEVLKYVPKDSVDKIPKTMIDTFNRKMDNNYIFSIDINKSFEEQELLEETKAILANIFRDYWATPYQKEQILAKEKYDRRKLEERKRILYDPNSIFEKEQINVKHENNKHELNSNLPIEIKKEKFYEKIIHFFKKIFNL